MEIGKRKMKIDTGKHAQLINQIDIAQETALAHFEQSNLKNPFKKDSIAYIEYVRFLCVLIKGN